MNASNARATFKQYCFSCHGKAAAGGINLEQLSTQESLGESFQHWEKVATALEQKRMPPAKMPQPGDQDRMLAAAWIRGNLKDFAEKHAGDPGRVTVRRLTSGEYGYTIQDLTGLDLRFDRDFVADSVGGEGFTNFGDVQFMQDATLERYLEAAKLVAKHAVVGAGPLGFFPDPGLSGFELSAIHRIQEIYTTHGFRAVAGEGGKAYGLEKYTQALYACWRYQHRAALGEPKATLEQLGAQEGLSPRFVQHIWSVVSQKTPSYPTSEVVTRFQALAVPKGSVAENKKLAATVRKSADGIQEYLINWPRMLFAAGELAKGGQGDERALVLTDESIQATAKHKFRFALRSRRQPVSSTVYLTVVGVNPRSKDKALVLWRNAAVRFRKPDRGPAGDFQPLQAVLAPEAVAKLQFGKRPDGGAIDAGDFVTDSDAAVALQIVTPAGIGGIEFQVEAELTNAPSGDSVVRATVSDNAQVAKGRPVWALLGDPKGAGFRAWKAGVLEYADLLPQISHGEPTPSDKDPIPAPFNNIYNQPERDHYHAKLKYYRQDQFLTEKMLDDATRERLEHAWADLYASFEYHDLFLRFVAEKYKLDLGGKGIDELDAVFIEQMPAEPKQYVKALRAEYDAAHRAQQASHARHLDDCLQFAAKAWRRPLTAAEKDKLRGFYTKSREVSKLDHDKAIRSLLARILVAPAFLYRLEQASVTNPGVKPLSNWELASRLSYFLWASVPDDELRRAAASGDLNNPVQLERQVKRMLADAKARRLSTEFFGQWLGFYRFDQYRGVDASRFPEFTDEVKAGMYDEAVSFFEHIVRKDRPVREMLVADYTFLNQSLAKHYGIDKDLGAEREVERVDGAGAYHRGGLLRLGAVLTSTSAPLRTSPVKRGDWLLRRVLGTPTPPPPPDAGSIPADPKAFAGQSVRERLAAHQRNATCAGCHTRIDPLGFPLERYDPVGRWRENYEDGKPVDDSAALADKTELAGVDGLVRYLEAQEAQVLRTFSQKLLGYALGRTMLASDQPLVERLVAAGGNANFSKLIVEIANSRQFRYRREKDEPSSAPNLARAQAQNSKVEGDR
jgi:mono/diheme cytochrome c family protein